MKNVINSSLQNQQFEHEHTVYIG